MTPQEQREAIRRKANSSRSKPDQAAPIEVVSSKNKQSSVPAWFDACRGGFWRLNSRGEWIPFTESAVRRVLKYDTFVQETDKNQLHNLVERELMKLQSENDVAYAGSIAGYTSGIHEICSQRVLVTSQANMILSKDIPWPTLKGFLESLLGDQVREFFAWMKSALRSYYAGAPFRPGQLLAIAGPAGCGKSLLQNLTTEMLGGRAAKPYRYMTGETSFNSDLLSAEHLMIEDEAASTDLRVRRHFGSMLKNMVVNEVQSLHRKGRDAMSVSPFWRITITLNDEPENLVVLPPIDESLRDKITLLRASMANIPVAADDMPARKLWRSKLSAEIPGFLHFLKVWRIPAAWVDVRYGVRAYQDADLLKELEDLSPEIRLLTLIDTLQVWGIDREDFVGTADELEEVLLSKDKFGRVGKLLSWNTACGVYLGRLKNRFPERFSESRSLGKVRKWKIKPPVLVSH